MNNTSLLKSKYFFLIIGVVATIVAIVLFQKDKEIDTPKIDNTEPGSEISIPKKISKVFAMPMDGSESRITKKHFGTYVNPKNSPVSPEVFTGYHTAVDLETFENEQKNDVPVFAICSGKILVKRVANGYGGMVVQSCSLHNDPVTVVYGHVRLKDMKTEVGDTLEAGDFLTNLGTGYSNETSNERKHLHLGIHKGSNPDTRGYIADKNDLKNWIDFEQYVK